MSTVAVSTEFKPLLLLDPSTLVFSGELPVSSEKSWSRKVAKDSPAGSGGSIETILVEDDWLIGLIDDIYDMEIVICALSDRCFDVRGVRAIAHSHVSPFPCRCCSFHSSRTSNTFSLPLFAYPKASHIPQQSLISGFAPFYEVRLSRVSNGLTFKEFKASALSGG